MKSKGAFFHSVGPKLSNGLTRNGHSVTQISDRDLARAHSLLGHRKTGVGGANRFLRRFCRDIGPQLLILGHADVIQSQTLADIRADWPGLRIVQWNVDPVFEPDNMRRIASKLEVVDATLVSSAGEVLRPLARPGMALGFMPNPVDFSVESGRNDQAEVLPFDLFLACGTGDQIRHIGGEAITPHQLLDRIEQAVPHIRFKLGGLRGTPHLVGNAYQQGLESARVGLNLSRRNDVWLYSSDRLAQMIGNGLTVLMDRATGYDALLGEGDAAFFATIPQLIEQIGHLIADPARARRIGGSGRARYHALFNERIVARYLVEVATQTLDPSAYAFPTLLDGPEAPAERA